MNLSAYIQKIKSQHELNTQSIISRNLAYDDYGYEYYFESVQQYNNYVKNFILEQIARDNIIEDISVHKVLKEELNIII